MATVQKVRRKATGAGKSRWRPFEEAREFVRGLALRSVAAWLDYCRSGLREGDIPANPDSVYKHQGWSGWGDFLGSHTVPTRERSYLSFIKARDFARALGKKNQMEWRAYSKTGEKPTNIPAAPWIVYKNQGWIGWGDWLGTGNIGRGTYRAFGEAREFVRALGLKSQAQWEEFRKSGRKPDDIPGDPGRIYRMQGWVNMGDWLGTGYVACRERSYRPFPEARTFIHSLNLRNRDEWDAFCKSDRKPDDIPVAVDVVYKDRGWAGFGDWLGVVNRWSQQAVLAFLRSHREILPHLTAPEVFTLCQSSGLTGFLRTDTPNSKSKSIIRDLVSLPSNPDPVQATIDLIRKAENVVDAEDDEFEDIVDIQGAAGIANLDDEIPTDLAPPETDIPPTDTARLAEPASLKAVDLLAARAHEFGFPPDDQAIEFLIANRVQALLQGWIAGDGSVNVEAIRADPDQGVHFNTIRSRFLPVVDGAKAIDVPDHWSLSFPPNRMQRVTAHLVQERRRLGNWSTTGAGKTLAAILASRVVDSRMTVVVVANATVGAGEDEGWAKVIERAFPDSRVIIRPQGPIDPEPERPTYVVINYEQFSRDDAWDLIDHLVDAGVDMMVIDEIQFAKRRDDQPSSKRRKAIMELIDRAGSANPGLYVLGMSATPVINSLSEAAALLELVTGLDMAEVKVTPTRANVHRIHQLLVLHGIRFRVAYAQKVREHVVEIRGDHAIEAITDAAGRGLLAIEQELLTLKLPAIVEACRECPSLVYTQYVDGMVGPLVDAIRDAGLRVGVYDGDDKTGRQQFLSGEIDVLVASAPIGTGVDGLQHVCNRLIYASLPWTSAADEHLRGRLVRQGSAFETADVFIPQVVLSRGGDDWSWDRHRMDRLKYKASLADAAVDGVQAQGELMKPEAMLVRAREALESWIARVEAGHVLISSAKAEPDTQGV